MVKIKIDRMEAPKDVNKGEISVVLRLDRETVQAYVDYYGTDVGMDLYALSRSNKLIFLTDEGVESLDPPQPTTEPQSPKDMLHRGSTLINEGMALLERANELIHLQAREQEKDGELFVEPEAEEMTDRELCELCKRTGDTPEKCAYNVCSCRACHTEGMHIPSCPYPGCPGK